MVERRKETIIKHLRDRQAGEPYGVVCQEASADQGEQEGDEAGEPPRAAGVQLLPKHGTITEDATTTEAPATLRRQNRPEPTRRSGLAAPIHAAKDRP